MKTLTALLLLPMFVSSANAAQGDLDWLAGCWVSADKSSQEVWVVDGDKSLIGFAVALRAGEVVFYELLHLEQNDEGTWTYTAHPAGQARTSFVAVDVRENSAVFTNPEHDYPQQISYRRDGSQLSATISLLGGDNPNSFDKLACK